MDVFRTVLSSRPRIPVLSLQVDPYRCIWGVGSTCGLIALVGPWAVGKNNWRELVALQVEAEQRFSAFCRLLKPQSHQRPEAGLSNRPSLTPGGLKNYGSAQISR